MKAEDKARFGPAPAVLKDGRSVTLRPLTQDDAEALGDFYDSVPSDDYDFYHPHPLTREKAAEKAAGALELFSICIVAEARGQEIAGYAWYTWEDDRAERSSLGICVARRWQGAGLGGALMRRLLEIDKEAGPPVMSLTVQKTNARALALYTKMGFRIVRDQLRGSDKEPEYYMERSSGSC